MITRHARRAQRARTRNRLLLAEDNLVNQKVALRLLEKLDYRVDVVADGLAAVAAWQTGKFDLIIMDCQMPQMDGYAATREIRRLEAGQRHIPIVALTAHAMKGDEQKCRAAGMDDYLSKPIDRTKLEDCLERLLPSTSATGVLAVLRDTLEAPSPPAGADALSPAAPSPVQVDWDALLESIDGDTGFARELVGAFVGTADRELAAIATAVGSGDAATLRESAHTLKGTSANLRASAAASAAARLETAARTGQSAEISTLADQLTTEVRAAIGYLKTKVG